MVTLSYIAAHPALSSFIHRYELFEFNTEDSELIRPWHATTDTHIIFFLQDKPLYLKNDQTGYYVEGSHDIAILGMATQFNGLMRFKGKYKIFTIKLMPNGLTRLFKFPLSEFVNRIYVADDLFGVQAKELLEQLQCASSIQEMACFTDKFLFVYLKKLKQGHIIDGITSITNTLLFSKGSLPVKEYARLANMSVRNFERRFSEQVGVAPKLYSRLLRFDQALAIKMKSPGRDWTSIASQCKYFDQTHMVKDFYQFAGISPKELFNAVPPPAVKTIFVPRILF